MVGRVLAAPLVAPLASRCLPSSTGGVVWEGRTRTRTKVSGETTVTSGRWAQERSVGG